MKVKEGLMVKKLVVFLSFLSVLLLTACGEVQNEYYEVHVMVVGESLFYYVDPSDGKDTFSANQFASGETLFVYLYEAEEGVTFSYEHYFTTIQERFVEENKVNGKLYVQVNSEIDNLITEYFIGKETWTAPEDQE